MEPIVETPAAELQFCVLADAVEVFGVEAVVGGAVGDGGPVDGSVALVAVTAARLLPSSSVFSPELKAFLFGFLPLFETLRLSGSPFSVAECV